MELLISIKPAYAHAILTGAKTVELRKRFPTDIKEGTKLLIYSSSPERALIGECKISKVVKTTIEELWSLTCRDAMISWAKYKEYFDGIKEGCGIYIHSPKMYEKPISLDKLRKDYDFTPPQSYFYNRDIVV